MEYVYDLLRERVLTALAQVKPPEGGGFDTTEWEEKDRKRLMEHLGIQETETPGVARLVLRKRFRGISYACLLTRSRLYYTGGKKPIELDKLRKVELTGKGSRAGLEVHTSPDYHFLRVPAGRAPYLLAVLEEIQRAFRLLEDTEVAFAAAAAAHEGPPLPEWEGMPSFAEFSMDPAQLFGLARVCLKEGDRLQGMDLLLLSADMGCADAQYALGLLFGRKGNPQQKDPSSAAYWMDQAAAQGHEAARVGLNIWCDHLEEGKALWAPRRKNQELAEMLRGDETQRQQAAEVCMERAEYTLITAYAASDRTLFGWDYGSDLERALLSIASLKESLAWRAFAKELGQPAAEAETRWTGILQGYHQDEVPKVQGQLQQADREEEAQAFRTWIDKLLH